MFKYDKHITMKTYKLIIHQKTNCNSELIVHNKDFPNAVVGDIVEVGHADSKQNKLLLQIMSFKDDAQSKDTISIEHSVAALFQLRAYSDVTVNIVTPESVLLDSVELTFRDQYLGRSEMWRIKIALNNTCVYNNKKLEFCGGYTRLQVYEMWSKGKLVSCGAINENTKIIFRSATSMIYIFLQMTSEMWEFNYLGDTYFEKSVDGFLVDLFDKWKKFGSNHEVTFVVFSRVFYDANKLDEFPESMRECLQVDYKNRFYEDFYRVVIQNERYEDWAEATLMLLRRLYYTYKRDVLNYHHNLLQDTNNSIDSIPKAYLSEASQGNFLEVLNMALNVFEKHYIERSLDRTGQLAIVISPGTGEFYVDRQLTNITKQRVMDNGVGIDLICIGQEPLYAVPLFLFQNRDEHLGDDYSIPHWINSRSKHIATKSTFIPRIKVPNKFSNITLNHPKVKFGFPVTRYKPASMRSRFSNYRQNYVDHDIKLFLKKKPKYLAELGGVANILPQKKTNENNTSKKKKVSTCSFDVNSDKSTALSRSLSPLKQRSITPPPKSKYEFINLPPLNRYRSQSIDEGFKKFAKNTDKENKKDLHLLKNSRFRRLFNPFKKSQLLTKVTSNRRRWSHLFPEKPSETQKSIDDFESADSAGMDVHEIEKNKKIKKKSYEVDLTNLLKNHIEEKQNIKKFYQSSSKREYININTPNMDWKSMVFPACLPITTDYFPDALTLESFYLFSNYNLLPDDVNAEVSNHRAVHRKPLTALEVFNQMICQRLSQGFQLIEDKSGKYEEEKKKMNSLVMRTISPDDRFIEKHLSVGRIIHSLTLIGSSIQVTRYRPKFPYATFEIQYRYRFQAPDHTTYGISWISFVTEKLETYYWNYMDHYLCARGDYGDYVLHEKMKYWRFRMYLLPWRHDATKTIMNHLNEKFFCDIYDIPTMEDQVNFTNKFIKFIETWVNRIKRSTISQRSASDTSPYRDRVGSLRPVDKPRPRSGSKVDDKSISLFSEIQDEFIDDVESKSNSTMISIEEPLEEDPSNLDIVRHMCSTQGGVGFVYRHTGLPPNTFVSSDAVTWLLCNVKTIKSRIDAVSRLHAILRDELICHASGDSSHPFIDGFYLYYVLIFNDSFFDRGIKVFEKEWVEVEAKQPVEYPRNVDFLMDNLPELEPLEHDSIWDVPWYKKAHLEMDVDSQSDLAEWGHARYQSLYRCDQAYEITAQWVAASGSVVADLIYNWARKAQTGGFQLIPLPADPFALPYTLKSDPLRGPVFVPLNLECLLTEGKNCLFSEYPEDTWLQRLLLFQKIILHRFGFMICNSNETESYQNQFIHLTGNAFVLILSELIDEDHENSDSPVQKLNELEISYYQQDLLFTPHMEYISRHVYHNVSKEKTEKRVGFMWAWNHMVSRRWKWSNPATGDEEFQNKLLDDFRHFCGNTDNRLLNFWNYCKNDYKKNYQQK